MSVCVVVQTCDLYEPYWAGFWNFMQKHWDFGISAPIRMFNEEKTAKAPHWCSQTLVGKGTFVQNLKKTIEQVQEDHIFLMLEDFWPVAPMTKKMFECLYDEFRDNDLDSLQVSNYTPYYKVRPTGRKILGVELMDFCHGSDWTFNYQARFWKKETLSRFLVEPLVSEREVGSAITAEMASDELAKADPDLKVRLFHYLWYPISGVSYRGQLTDFGRHLHNIVEIDEYVEAMLSRSDASGSLPGCSG